jgi:predicted DsbA family dithiol-disulfide isomerase
MKMNNTLKVEIWSDIICPFCYIGKRKFESALKQFEANDNIEITWKSFQLAPDMKTDTSISIDEYLAIHKGFSIEKAREMNTYVTQIAKQEGLSFNFDRSIVANTLLAHQMLHFARTVGKQEVTKERLLKAYFTDGKNIDDEQTLLELATEIGLDIDKLNQALNSNDFVDEVKADIDEAQQLGVRGVPFFVFNRSHAISGAQLVEVFVETIQQVLKQTQEEIILSDDQVCDIDGNCD